MGCNKRTDASFVFHVGPSKSFGRLTCISHQQCWFEQTFKVFSENDNVLYVLSLSLKGSCQVSWVEDDEVLSLPPGPWQDVNGLHEAGLVES